MRKLICIVFWLLSFHESVSQITFTDGVKKKEEYPQYDSSRNFLGLDFKQYKGQKLLLLPKKEELRNYGYEGFKIIKNNNFETYMGGSSYSSRSSYDSLAGTYFMVASSKGNDFSLSEKKYLVLVSMKYIDTVYYEYSAEFKSSFPFLATGYFEKMKSRYKGEELFVNINGNEVFDIDTGIKIDLINGEYFYCEDITVNSEDYKLALLLRDKDNNRFLFSLYGEIEKYPVEVLLKSEAVKISNRVGYGIWKDIIDRKLKIGFTEEMVRMAWGEPKEINRSSDGDQWVYSNQFLYFENGKFVGYN